MRDATEYGQAPAGRGAEVCPRKWWNAPVPFHPGAPTTGTPIPVYISEGRWVVMCPDCAGAQLASLDDQRFMCVTCANVVNGNAWRPTAWPAERVAIEHALEIRPFLFQNWLPGETVADLLAENAAHGYGG